MTTELLERIARLYSVEEEVRGQPPDTRRAARQARSKPQLDELRARMEEIRAKLSAKSALAVAITYALKRWPALIRYCENGRLAASSRRSPKDGPTAASAIFCMTQLM